MTWIRNSFFALAFLFTSLWFIMQVFPSFFMFFFYSSPFNRQHDLIVDGISDLCHNFSFNQFSLSWKFWGKFKETRSPRRDLIRRFDVILVRITRSMTSRSSNLLRQLKRIKNIHRCGQKTRTLMHAENCVKITNEEICWWCRWS